MLTPSQNLTTLPTIISRDFTKAIRQLGQSTNTNIDVETYLNHQIGKEALLVRAIIKLHRRFGLPFHFTNEQMRGQLSSPISLATLERYKANLIKREIIHVNHIVKNKSSYYLNTKKIDEMVQDLIKSLYAQPGQIEPIQCPQNEATYTRIDPQIEGTYTRKLPSSLKMSNQCPQIEASHLISKDNYLSSQDYKLNLSPRLGRLKNFENEDERGSYNDDLSAAAEYENYRASTSQELRQPVCVQSERKNIASQNSPDNRLSNLSNRERNLHQTLNKHGVATTLAGQYINRYNASTIEKLIGAWMKNGKGPLTPYLEACIANLTKPNEAQKQPETKLSENKLGAYVDEPFVGPPKPSLKDLPVDHPRRPKLEKNLNSLRKIAELLVRKEHHVNQIPEMTEEEKIKARAEFAEFKAKHSQKDPE